MKRKTPLEELDRYIANSLVPVPMINDGSFTIKGYEVNHLTWLRRFREAKVSNAVGPDAEEIKEYFADKIVRKLGVEITYGEISFVIAVPEPILSEGESNLMSLDELSNKAEVQLAEMFEFYMDTIVPNFHGALLNGGLRKRLQEDSTIRELYKELKLNKEAFVLASKKLEEAESKLEELKAEAKLITGYTKAVSAQKEGQKAAALIRQNLFNLEILIRSSDALNLEPNLSLLKSLQEKLKQDSETLKNYDLQYAQEEKAAVAKLRDPAQFPEVYELAKKLKKLKAIKEESKMQEKTVRNRVFHRQNKIKLEVMEPMIPLISNGPAMGL